MARGRIAAGFRADNPVLDWDGYTERGMHEAPSQLASGVLHVLVDGMPTLRDGALTGHSAGEVIRR